MAEQITTLASLTVDGKGSYGIGASAVPFSRDLYTYLRITDIKDDGTLNLQDLKSVDDDKASEYLLKPNDIVFARTGASTGRNYFYDGTDGKFVYAGFLIKFSIDEKKVNPKYIKYFCQSKQYKDWINSFNTGSTRGNINAQTLGKMPIPLIERKKQDALVSILSSIDEKIKKNEAINNNLEQQAQLLFSQDFGQYTFATNESEESDLPESWKYYKMADLCKQIKPGTNYQPKRVESGIPFLNVRCVNQGYIDTSDAKFITEAEYARVHKTWQPEKDDLLISRIGTLGLVAAIRKEDLPLAVHYNFINIKIDKLPFEFMYFLLKSKHFQAAYHFIKKQSVQEYVTIDEVEDIRIPFPDIDTIDFSLYKKIYEMIVNNQRENKALTNLRDELLPRLMSGELDVSEIDI